MLQGSELIIFILLGILALLPIAVIYLIIDRNKSKKKIRELEEELALLKKDKKKDMTSVDEDKMSTNDIFITVGSILIGGGIITLFGINWQNISFFWKHIIAFLPTLLAFLLSYIFYNEEKYKKYRVGLSVFAPLVIYASFSLIFSLYELDQNAHVVSFIVSLIIIPVVLFYNRVAGLITYYIITLFAISLCFSDRPYLDESYLPLIKSIVLFIPTIIYFVYHYLKDKFSLFTKVNFIALIGLGTAILIGQDLFSGLSHIAYLGGLALFTNILFNRDNLVWYLIIIALTISVLFLPVDIRLDGVIQDNSSYVIMHTFVFFILGIIYYIKNRRFTLDLYPVVLGFVPLIYLINIPILSDIIANGLLIGYGVLLVKRGIENKETITRLLGLGIFLFLIIKFAIFVEELELVTLILVVCGGIFIFVSNYINKLVKEKQDE